MEYPVDLTQAYTKFCKDQQLHQDPAQQSVINDLSNLVETLKANRKIWHKFKSRKKIDRGIYLWGHPGGGKQCF